MRSDERLWTSTFLLASAINFSLTVVFYLLVVVIGTYAVRELNASLGTAGLVVGMFIVGTLTGRLLIGQIVDRWGRKPIVLVGMCGFVLISLFYSIVDHVGALIVVRFLHGMALGIASTAIGAIVASSIPASRKAEGIGYFSLSTTLASALGPFLGLIMMQHVGYTPLFWLCTLSGVLGLIGAVFLRLPALKLDAAARPRQSTFSWRRLIAKQAVPIACVSFLAALCYASVLAFIQPYAEKLDLVDAASFFFMVYSIGVLLSRPWTGPLMDKRGPNLVMFPCAVVLALGMLILVYTHEGVYLLLAGVLIGFGFGNLQSGTQAIAVKVVDPSHMGLATSTFFIFLEAGLGFGPSLLGLLIPFTGYENLFLLMAVLALVVALVYWLVHGRKVTVLGY